MNFLFKKTDISYLIFFRLVFGVLATIEAIVIFSYLHLHKKAFKPEDFHFKYYGFEWVNPMPEPFMSIFFVLLTLLALCILVGWHYRLCTSLYALGFSYTFFLDASFYLNHGYLFMLLCFAMIFFPAHRAYSLDVLQKRVTPIPESPYWPLFLLKFMIAIVYIYGGIAKINPDWLDGKPLKYWLAIKSEMFLLGPIIEKNWVAYFMSYSGLLLDLFVVPFLLIKKTRPWAFGFVLFFHFINLLIFEIGIFPWLSTALTALFFPPDFPRRMWYWLSAKISKLTRIGNWWEKLWKGDMARQVDLNYTALQKKTIAVSLFLFCSIQLLIPLRHHLYKGKVVWNEQGHRYAWRMMLRDKKGTGDFKIVDPHSKKSIKVRPNKYLTKRQTRKLYTHPYMILQFAHYLRDKYSEEGFINPEVYANLKIKLNGRSYKRYVDPEVDLGAVEWDPFRTASWISPTEASEFPEQ